MLGQNGFFVELANTALDHLFNDVVGLAGFTGLLDEDRALTRDRRRIEIFDAQRLRQRRRHVHCDLFAKVGEHGLIARRFQSDQHANAANAVADGIVDVGGHHALRDRHVGRATQSHVLADGRDEVGDVVLHRAFEASARRSLDFLKVALRGKRQCCNRLGGVLELVVPGDKVGFGIQLDHRAFSAGCDNADEPFGRSAVCLLRGLREAFGAQPIDGGFEVAIVFLQGLLAIHHAYAGLFAQVLDQCSGDFRHGSAPRLSARRVRARSFQFMR